MHVWTAVNQVLCCSWPRLCRLTSTVLLLLCCHWQVAYSVAAIAVPQLPVQTCVKVLLLWRCSAGLGVKTQHCSTSTDDKYAYSC